MDLAFANYDAPQRYMQRHGIRRVFEQAEVDLLLKRPESEAAVTECIVETLQRLIDATRRPPKKVILVLAEPGTAAASAESWLADVAASFNGAAGGADAPGCSLIQPTLVAQAPALIAAAPGKYSLLAPTTATSITAAVEFECTELRFHSVLLLRGTDFHGIGVGGASGGAAPSTQEGQGAEGDARRQYALQSYPVLAYFDAQRRLTEFDVAQGKEALVAKIAELFATEA